ncbi:MULTISPECIES: iron-sulfur cluster assembly scaffold protein [Cryobacterium]|uniref:Iron-sulfur cluster assembly scaffold protein n=1 Tax=Cryobacterium breve TaxID=1259258 RepID=A0ABY2IYL2_9MICO|nr:MULTISPECIES: iron-sulfur cluster assembly scaffold protein [Cryobacterium]TFC93871.1 iron-sulfur cluster assembly scaffold protein [Cryobacterium sp. TmT3-12]TFC97609.1 iron-sulfur cluster assembly scaffold protein [Cryobacterium breve]
MTNSAMQQLYQQIILDHAKSRNGAPAGGLPPLGEVGTVPGASPTGAGSGLRVTESHQVNTTCGDEVTLRIGVRGGEAGGPPASGGVPASGAEPTGDAVIEEFAWAGDGCSISMASASVLHDTVWGEDVATARAVLNTFREMLRSRGTIEPDEEVLGDAAAFAGVSRYPARVKCAMLPWVAFEAALLAE